MKATFRYRIKNSLLLSYNNFRSLNLAAIRRKNCFYDIGQFMNSTTLQILEVSPALKLEGWTLV